MQAWDALRATLNPFSIASRPRTVPAGRGAGRRVVFAVDSSDYRQVSSRLDQENNNPPALTPTSRPHPAPQRRRRALRRRPPRARQRFVLVRVRVPQSPAVPARARRQRQPAQPNLGSAGECRRVGRPGPFPRSVGEARPGIAALKSTIPPVSSTAPFKPTHRSHPPTRPVSHHERSPRGTTSYEYNPSGWIESAALKQSPRTPTTRRSAAFVPCPSTCCHVPPRAASRRPSWSTAT